MNEIQNTGINLGGNQCHPVWRKAGVMKGNGKSTVRLLSIAASCQQTADPAKSLGQRHRRHQRIKEPKKIQIFYPAVHIRRKDSPDNAAKHNEPIRQGIPEKARIGHNALPLCDPVQDLCPKKAAKHAPYHKVKNIFVRKSPLFGSAFSRKVSCQYPYRDHQSIPVNGKGSYFQQFIFHNKAPLSSCSAKKFFQNFRSSRFAASFLSLSAPSGSHSPQIST